MSMSMANLTSMIICHCRNSMNDNRTASGGLLHATTFRGRRHCGWWETAPRSFLAGDTLSSQQLHPMHNDLRFRYPHTAFVLDLTRTGVPTTHEDPGPCHCLCLSLALPINGIGASFSVCLQFDTALGTSHRVLLRSQGQDQRFLCGAIASQLNFIT